MQDMVAGAIFYAVVGGIFGSIFFVLHLLEAGNLGLGARESIALLFVAFMALAPIKYIGAGVRSARK